VTSRSTKPLIATALTIEAPPGVRVERIAYPAAPTLKQEGRSSRLAVFGHEFTIAVPLALTPEIGSGEIRVPARLRYQACDETNIGTACASDERIVRLTSQRCS
jgi:hypothetical protein